MREKEKERERKGERRGEKERANKALADKISAGFRFRSGQVRSDQVRCTCFFKDWYDRPAVEHTAAALSTPCSAP